MKESSLPSNSHNPCFSHAPFPSCSFEHREQLFLSVFNYFAAIPLPVSEGKSMLHLKLKKKKKSKTFKIALQVRNSNIPYYATQN